MANQYGLSIWSKVFLCSAILFVGSEAKTSISAIDLGADGHNANSTYFDNWQDQFVIDPLAAITTQIDPGSLRQGNFGNRPHKRQNCQGSGSTSQNRCFAGNTAANAYCACSNRCCTNTAKSTGWCCSATVDCDVAALGCKWITSTTSIVRTVTSYVTNYFTTAVTLPGGTSTSLVVITRTSTITISSADTATIFATTTISQLQAGKRDYTASSAAAGIPTQPAQTTNDPSSSVVSSTQENDVVAPQITQAPSVWEQEENKEIEVQNEELRKRQAAPTTTVVIGTATIYVTTFITVGSTGRASATTTSTTTTWSSTTVFLNAKATQTVMTTLNLATVSGPVAPARSSDPIRSSDPAQSSDPAEPIANPNKGLSTGAKAGIGAGAAGGSLLLFAILGMVWRRKKKNEKEKNQEMINSAVTAAVVAQQGPPGQSAQTTTSYIASDKTAYKHTYDTSPNKYGTPTGISPQHSPAPAYPAPMNTMPYTTSEVSAPPSQYSRLSELPDHNMVPPSLQVGAHPVSYGAPPVGYAQAPEMAGSPVPPYGGYPQSPEMAGSPVPQHEGYPQSPEMAGSPVPQRYEMPSYNETSPHNFPVPHGGPQQYPGGPQQNYNR